jgi:DNA polymerase
MREVVLDFETCSGIDLKIAGSSAYAQHPTTEVLCLSFEWSGTIATWTPGDASLAGTELWRLAVDSEVTFVAHGAGFEKDIWRYIMVPQFGFPDIPNSRWADTMSVCAMKQIPQQLEVGARVLGLNIEKDMEGSRLTVGLSRFNKKTGMLPERTPEIMERVYRYCETDVRTQRSMLNRIGHLTEGERKVWLLDQRINERGVRIDLDYVSACRGIVDKASKPLAAEFTSLTGLKVSQAVKIADWVRGQGVVIPNLTKETLAVLLGDDDEEDQYDYGETGQDIPGDVHRALSIRRLIGSASIKKLSRMEQCVGGDGRVRRLLQYHGAGPGRWAGRLLQPQNFPRGTLEIDDKAPPPEIVVDAIMSRDPEYVAAVIGPPVETVVSGLRHALIPDLGRKYLSGDFAQIEARIVLALAGEQGKLDIMRAGGSLYLDMGGLIYSRPLDKKKDPEEYQTAKNTVLGLGFQMGWRKFKARYAKDKPDEFAQRIVKLYREVWAPGVPDVWGGLEEAAVRTVWDKTPHEAYGVLYALEDGWLTARLMNGRKIWYRDPQPVRKVMPWDDTDVRPAWTYRALKMGQVKTIDAFGGLLTENVVQGLARDLLVTAMFKLEKENFPIVLTVHDEALAEPMEKDVDEQAFAQVMTDLPSWARELQVPVAVETWSGGRYRK